MLSKSEETKTVDAEPAARQILIAGLALGLSGNYLLWFGPQGPGFVVWTVLLGGTVLWLNRGAGTQRLCFLLLWTGIAVLAALMLTLRATPVLVPIMGLVMLTAAAMTLLHTQRVGVMETQVADLIAALFSTGFRAGTSAFSVLRRVDFSVDIPHPRLLGIGRGLLLSLPLLALFIGLFSGADAKFNSYVSNFTDVFSESALRHLIWTCVFTWVAMGFLSCTEEALLSPRRNPLSFPRLGVEETTVIMALLSALFLLFVMLQLNYLFGGRATIEATSGLTLANYARRGFFELVTVAVLTLVLLLALASGSAGQRWFRILAAVMVSCVLVILASAAQRLQLYISQYGLTLDRLVAVAVMLWLTTSLLLFAFTVLRERNAGFASGTALSGIVIALLLALANPAAMVARVNIDNAITQARQGKGLVLNRIFVEPDFATLDIDYLIRLGNDAVPELLKHIDDLPLEYKCRLNLRLNPGDNLVIRNPTHTKDWRKRNRGDRAAIEAVEDKAEKLKQECSN